MRDRAPAAGSCSVAPLFGCLTCSTTPDAAVGNGDAYAWLWASFSNRSARWQGMRTASDVSKRLLNRWDLVGVTSWVAKDALYSLDVRSARNTGSHNARHTARASSSTVAGYFHPNAPHRTIVSDVERAANRSTQHTRAAYSSRCVAREAQVAASVPGPDAPLLCSPQPRVRRLGRASM